MKFFNNLSSKEKLLISILLVALIVILLSIYTTDFKSTVLISLFILALLTITKSIWLSPEYGNTLIRRLSLIIALSAISTYTFWNSLISKIIVEIGKNLFPDLFNEIPEQNNISPALGYGFLLAVIFIVNFFIRNKTIIKRHEKSIEDDIPEPDFKDKFEAVINSLSDDLRSIDLKSNWSIRKFIPLDAEVEIQISETKKKKITNLISALKSNSQSLFLLIGDPGSGKSVCLRKLSQELLRDSMSTGKLPVYINLREWQWDAKIANNKPSIENLVDFIYKNLINRDIVCSEFFKKYFHRLMETGRLYFILDSFDEIPAVLGEDENSEAIIHLSELFYKFFRNNVESAHGILSSRPFRRPTKDFFCNIKLEIRPFSEKKIINMLKRSNVPEEFIKEIFASRTDLFQIARNPFNADLLTNFINNNNKLPVSKISIYENFISETLDGCSDRIKRKNISKEKVLNVSVAIANEMFNKYGLEAPINEIIKNNTDNFEEVIDILTFSRICRISSGDQNLFSFSHRRFCEYFSILKLEKSNIQSMLPDIPTDSKWRDALVLYCELADFEIAKSVAEYCWVTIQQNNDPRNIQSIHAMRFLRDAFKNRIEAISSFKQSLSEYINLNINSKSEIITIKLAIETVGLLEESEVDSAIVNALKLNNSWLNETSIRACRHLKKISVTLENELMFFFSNINYLDLIKLKDSYNFSLKLSEAFKKILWVFRANIFDFYGLIIALMASIIFDFEKFYVIAIYIFSMAFIELFFKWLYSSNPLPISKFILISRIALFVTFFGPADDYLAKFISQFDIDKHKELFEHKTLMEKIIQITYSIFYLPLFTILLKIKYYKKKIFIKIREFIKKAFIPIIGSIIILVIGFIIVRIVIMELMKHKNIQNIIETISLILVVLMLLFIIYEAFRFCNQGKKSYAKINYNLCNQRIHIYNYYNSLNEYPYYQRKFLTYLENNVSAVSGDWPNRNILEYSVDKNKIILSRLEEKWLGISE